MSKKTIDIAVGVLINNNGEVLLTQRYSPENPSVHMKWQLPGGAVEPNESIEMTCQREVFEETGFKVKLLSKEPFTVESKVKDTIFSIKAFRAEVVSGTIDIEKDEETNDAKWFDPKSVRHLKTLEYTFEIINACLN